MEVRLEALEGQTVPQETYLSLRIGAVQKQSRLAPSSGNRTFHFPEPKDGSKAEFGRIEVYKKIGHCQVPLAGLDEFPRDLQIECDDAALETLGLRIEIGPEGVAEAKDRVSQKAKRKKDKLDEAQKYIADHNLEELLAASLRDVMRKQPGDPASFLSGQILEKKSMKPTLPPLGEKKGKAKNANRSQSEPRKGQPSPPDRKASKGALPKPPDEVASPAKSRPAAPPKVPSMSPPADEPPEAIPPKALSRSASWCGSGVGPSGEDSPKSGRARGRQPRLERAAPDFRSAPLDFWGELHSHFPQAGRRRWPSRSPGSPERSHQVGGPLSPCGQAQRTLLASGLSPTARFIPSPAGHGATSGSTSPLAMARSYPLPEPPQELLRALQLQSPMSASSPSAYPMRAVSPVMRPPGGKVGPGYIQDLKGAINEKEAKLRALAAQLQELARLQQTTQTQTHPLAAQ